jgi:hypothetical protein
VALALTILARPAGDLAGEIIARTAIALQPDRVGIIAMELRQGLVDRIAHRGALVRIEIGHATVEEDAARDMRHQVEGRADDLGVLLIDQRLGHRETLGVERREDAMLAIDRVGRGQSDARRLAAQHIGAVGRVEDIGGVGLAALELAHAHRRGEARQPLLQEALEPAEIEAVRRLDLDDVAEIFLGRRIAHRWPPSTVSTVPVV